MQTVRLLISARCLCGFEGGERGGDAAAQIGGHRAGALRFALEAAQADAAPAGAGHHHVVQLGLEAAKGAGPHSQAFVMYAGAAEWPLMPADAPYNAPRRKKLIA